MIKRDIVETTYEYDKEGKLLKKTVIETHEEEDNTITTSSPWTYLNGTNPCCVDGLTTRSTSDYPKTTLTNTTTIG